MPFLNTSTIHFSYYLGPQSWVPNCIHNSRCYTPRQKLVTRQFLIQSQYNFSFQVHFTARLLSLLGDENNRTQLAQYPVTSIIITPRSLLQFYVDPRDALILQAHATKIKHHSDSHGTWESRVEFQSLTKKDSSWIFGRFPTRTSTPVVLQFFHPPPEHDYELFAT